MKKISKLEFIKQIVDLLRSEVDEKELRLILKDYTLYFNNELEVGKSEEDVLTFLYSPELFIETLRKSNLEETLKKLGQDDYNIFVDLIKDYKNNTSDSITSTSNKDDTSDSDSTDSDSTNSDNNSTTTASDTTGDSPADKSVVDTPPITNTVNKNNIPNTKKGIGYIINFLLGLILLVIFIPIIACGFIAGLMLISLSILFSSTISLLYGFLSLISIIFIMLSSLCLLMFGIGTICLNIQLTINYIKYFFLINSIPLEDTQNA